MRATTSRYVIGLLKIDVKALSTLRRVPACRNLATRSLTGRSLKGMCVSGPPLSDRQLVTLGMLTALVGREPQLDAHGHVTLNAAFVAKKSGVRLQDNPTKGFWVQSIVATLVYL